METLKLISELGFPVVICGILLWSFKKLGAVLLEKVVDPLVNSHRVFLVKMEEQLEIQSELLHHLVELQKDILDRIASQTSEK